MRKTRTAYATFRTRLIACCALLMVLLASLLSWKVYAGYHAEHASASALTNSFAQAMGAHVASEMQVVDLSLIRSAEALGAMDQATLNNPARVRAALAVAASVADASFWIQFVDRRGIGVVASNALPIAGVSYADRPYFQASAGHCGAGLYVGTPEIGRISKRRLFFLSRAVCSPAGAPLGVVVAPVDAGAIARVFASALFQPTQSITLLHRDGWIIARAPLFERSFGQNLAAAEIYRKWKTVPSGSYASRSIVDQQVRQYAFRTVAQLPLAVAVGMTTVSWTDALRQDFALAAGALLAIVTVLVVSGRFALRSFERIERSDARQRELNNTLVQMRDDLAAVVRRAHRIADSLPALIAYLDADERYVFHNSYYRSVPGVDVERMLGRTMREVLGDEIYMPVRDKVQEVLAGATVTFERALTVNGSGRHMKYSYTPELDPSGAVIGFYTMIIDISEAKQVEARLSTLARVDDLTGLPNRNHLYERLDEALARSRRGACPTACLYLDIDHFKAINDTLGHAGGDAVLRQFAMRLRACVRQTDLVARLAGDEFVIVLEGLDQPDAARAVAAKIIAAMRAPFAIDAVQRSVSTSVGVALSQGELDADALLRKADAALYQAKRAGRGNFVADPAGPGALT